MLDDAVKKGGGSGKGELSNNPLGNNQYKKKVDAVYNINSIQNKKSNSDNIDRPSGTSKEYGLRALKTHRPDLHQEVINEKLSVNAAMIEAGLSINQIDNKLFYYQLY